MKKTDKLTYKTLFNLYQNKLNWINRRLQPDVLKFYKEKASTWKHAKEVLFNYFQDLRYFVEGGIPEFEKTIFYDKELVKDVPPYSGDFPAIGILKYRDREFVIYDNDCGMETFIVVDGKPITIDMCGGSIDWYYEVDRLLDKI